MAKLSSFLPGGTFVTNTTLGITTTNNIIVGSSTNTASPTTTPLQVTGNSIFSGNVGVGTINAISLLSLGSVVGIDTNTTTVATTSATTIDSFSTSVYRSSRVQVQITQSTNYQASDILVIHDGTTATIVEYGSIATNDYLGTFSATVSGGNCLLRINMNGATSATVKALSQKITI